MDSGANPSELFADVAIVGAGIAGMAAGQLLKRHGKKVIILEASNRCGGRVFPMTCPLNLISELPSSRQDSLIGACACGKEIIPDPIVQCGANWVHDLREENPIYRILLEGNVPLEPTVGDGEIDPTAMIASASIKKNGNESKLKITSEVGSDFFTSEELQFCNNACSAAAVILERKREEMLAEILDERSSISALDALCEAFNELEASGTLDTFNGLLESADDGEANNDESDGEGSPHRDIVSSTATEPGLNGPPQSSSEPLDRANGSNGSSSGGSALQGTDRNGFTVRNNAIEETALSVEDSHKQQQQQQQRLQSRHQYRPSSSTKLGFTERQLQLINWMLEQYGIAENANLDIVSFARWMDSDDDAMYGEALISPGSDVILDNLAAGLDIRCNFRVATITHESSTVVNVDSKKTPLKEPLRGDRNRISAELRNQCAVDGGSAQESTTDHENFNIIAQGYSLRITSANETTSARDPLGSTRMVTDDTFRASPVVENSNIDLSSGCSAIGVGEDTNDTNSSKNNSSRRSSSSNPHSPAVRMASPPIIHAKQVIVTVPLGVLSASSSTASVNRGISFVPPLPKEVRKALAGVEMGLMDIVVLRFAREFWPENALVFGRTTCEGRHSVIERLSQSGRIVPIQRSSSIISPGNRVRDSNEMPDPPVQIFTSFLNLSACRGKKQGGDAPHGDNTIDGIKSISASVLPYLNSRTDEANSSTRPDNELPPPIPPRSFQFERQRQKQKQKQKRQEGWAAKNGLDLRRMDENDHEISCCGKGFCVGNPPCCCSWDARGRYPLLIAQVYGRAAAVLEDLTIPQIAKEATAALSDIFGAKTMEENPILGCVTHKWGKDENSFGSWTVHPLGGAAKDVEILGTPICGLQCSNADDRKTEIHGFSKVIVQQDPRDIASHREEDRTSESVQEPEREIERERPSCGVCAAAAAVGCIQIAGEGTDMRQCGTMQAAFRSGHRAAQHIINTHSNKHR